MSDRVNSAFGKKGNTALACAAKEGHLEVVKLLLSRGAAADLGDQVSREVLAGHPANGRIIAKAFNMLI